MNPVGDLRKSSKMRSWKRCWPKTNPETQQQLADQLGVDHTTISARLKLAIIPLTRPEWDKRQNNAKHFILFHDKAPVHASRTVKDTIQELNWDALPPALYSPDLAPSYYHLFAAMANGLSTQHFKSYEGVQKWLENWIAGKDKTFSNEESENCLKGGRCASLAMVHISNKSVE